ncbi:MAG: Tad domain-containing protein [Chloroflexi bacterium]|nr:Tad domain-containing protein [Chloroflexota bacterium]
MMRIFLKPSAFKKGERGQAMIMIVFSIIGLIGAAALAIDGGNAYVDRRRAESAASATALTGAVTRIEGGDWRSAALATAAANGYDNNGITNTVELNTPPTSDPYSGDPEYIEVIITSYVDTYFGPVIGVPQVINRVKAISQSKPAVLGEMFDGYALVSLAPHSRCDRNQSFWIHEEATVSLEGGGIFINSDNKDCAFIQFGSGSVRINDESPFTVVGGAQVQKPKLITPFPMQTGAIPISYPPAFQMPKVSCGAKIATADELTGTITSGSWGSEDFPPEGIHTLESGNYCLDGDFVLDGGERLTGSNVVFYLKHGGIKISGNAEVQISAPRGGPLKGLLIYLPIKNKSILSLNGDGDSNFTGTILAPGADVRLNGMSSNEGFRSQIVGYTIEVDGQSNIIIKYKDDQNYDAFKMPEVILVQ